MGRACQIAIHRIADIFVLATLALTVGMAAEVLMSGLSVSQSVQSRPQAIPLNGIVARPFGVYRDGLFDGAAGGRKRSARALLAIFAFTTFMQPQAIATPSSGPPFVGAEG